MCHVNSKVVTTVCNMQVLTNFDVATLQAAHKIS